MGATSPGSTTRTSRRWRGAWRRWLWPARAATTWRCACPPGGPLRRRALLGATCCGGAAMTSDQRTIRVLVLYPEVMDVYADRGNLIALRARAAAHDIALEVTNVGLGDPLPEDADLMLIGGGQD